MSHAPTAKRSNLERYAPPAHLDLDPGIREYVLILRSEGIETYESCQGGEGHAFPEPTIRFHGNNGEGFKALSVAMTYGLPVLALRRAWRVDDGELTGPWWEMTFRTKGPFQPTNRCQQGEKRNNLPFRTGYAIKNRWFLGFFHNEHSESALFPR